MKWVFLVILGVLLLLTHSQSFGQDQVTSEILNLVNAERTRLGLNQLYINTALIQASQRHSNDMAQGEFLSHTGSDGSEFWERMSDAGYAMTTGAENVQSRNDLSASEAFDLWWNSPTHNANMVNPDYTEIGIAYAQSPSGAYYFTMLLANRADFAPPQPTLPPATNTLAPPTPFPTLTPSVPPPPSATSTIIPTVPTATPTEDISLATLNEIKLQAILVLLIGQTGVIESVIQPTPTPLVVQQPTSIPPTPSPIPEFEVQLIYDFDSFSLINNTNRPLYLEGLYFESETGALDIARWNTEFLSAPLTQFPRGGCLQVWGLGYSSPLAPPSECEVRHSWIAVNDSATFWQGTTRFDVYLFGEWVTTCTVTAGRCLFNLSDRVDVGDSSSTTSSQTNTQQTNFPAEMRLIYTQDSFTILNTSGRDLDMTGLGFSSASGTVGISQWQTEFLSRPLNAFPTGDCLQAWSVNIAEYPPKPAECGFRHAWIGLADSQLFWANTDFFSVSRGGGVLATCNVSAGVCDVDLP